MVTVTESDLSCQKYERQKIQYEPQMMQYVLRTSTEVIYKRYGRIVKRYYRTVRRLLTFLLVVQLALCYILVLYVCTTK